MDVPSFYFPVRRQWRETWTGHNECIPVTSWAVSFGLVSTPVTSSWLAVVWVLKWKKAGGKSISLEQFFLNTIVFVTSLTFSYILSLSFRLCMVCKTFMHLEYPMVVFGSFGCCRNTFIISVYMRASFQKCIHGQMNVAVLDTNSVLAGDQYFNTQNFSRARRNASFV